LQFQLKLALTELYGEAALSSYEVKTSLNGVRVVNTPMLVELIWSDQAVFLRRYKLEGISTTKYYSPGTIDGMVDLLKTLL